MSNQILQSDHVRGRFLQGPLYAPMYLEPDRGEKICDHTMYAHVCSS